MNIKLGTDPLQPPLLIKKASSQERCTINTDSSFESDDNKNDHHDDDADQRDIQYTFVK